ncbi:retrovirus-related pol polyprotein from transposon TNT 1-94 [Tanacetum coccineum]
MLPTNIIYLYVCPAVGSTYADTMTDMNIPANDAPADQAPAVTPPTRTDDQILPLSKWVPIDKSNCVLDVHKPQRNPIFLIAVALLKNTNFFRAFTSSSTISAIYIQQFWDTMKNLATASCGKKKTAYLLIPNVRFTKLIIHYLKTKHNIHPRTGLALHYSHEESVLNTLRYVGKDDREIFGMSIPDALLTDEIKRAPYFSGYLEHVAEYQCYLDEEHDKAEEEEVATESPKATKVTKPKAAKATKPVGDKATKPTTTQTPKPKPAPTQPSKAISEKKRKLVKETPDEPSPAKRSKGGLVGKRRKPKSPLKLVDEPSDEGVPVEDPAHTDEEADLQWALELSLKEQAERTQGPARPVVLKEPDSRKYQPLPKVQEKGKEKVVDEQAAQDLQTPTKKSPVD